MTMSAISSEIGVVRRVRLSYIWISLVILLPLIAIPLLPNSGEAAPCTKGVNCYCDRVRGGELKDTSLLLCEDFEAPTLVNDQGFGNGAPHYGPWYDNTGFAGCSRGQNSYWFKTYFNGSSGGQWTKDTPATPKRGCQCSYPVCLNGAWHPTDLWQANSFAPMAILRDQDFSVEVPSITKPTNTASGSSGVFDGNASLGHRILVGHTGGILGVAPFSTVRTFGITMAVAYPSNSLSSGIWNQPWKHNEWAPGNAGLFLFHQPAALTSQDPFFQFTFASGDTQAVCQTKLAAATKVAGQFLCDRGGAFYFRADPTLYNRASDWPFGTWGCPRGEFRNLGLVNSAIKIWFTGPAGVEKKIIDISDMDLTGQNVKNGVNGLTWNNYANANSSPPASTTETTFRYEDNVHIRAGAPVSCSQIGFGAQRRPSPPTGTQLR